MGEQVCLVSVVNKSAVGHDHKSQTNQKRNTPHNQEQSKPVEKSRRRHFSCDSSVCPSSIISVIKYTFNCTEYSIIDTCWFNPKMPVIRRIVHHL